MKLGYSEFSFGYAFTENLIRSTSSGAAIAPYFPNLRDEGSLGYDVDIRLPGRPLFLQFKLPDRTIKNNVRARPGAVIATAPKPITSPIWRCFDTMSKCSGQD